MANIQDSDKKGLGVWYWTMTQKQKILCWVVAVILLIVPWANIVGFIALVLLFYCQLGKERYVNSQRKIDINKNNPIG